jgi:hypothetical protein
MDHREIAEQLLAGSDQWVQPGINPDGRPNSWPSALTHAILALCDSLAEVSCLVAIPGGVEGE